MRKKDFYPTSIFYKEDLVEVQNKISTNWSFDEYLKKGINKNKLEIALKLINQIKNIFNKYNLNFDVFFTETKITVTNNGKVWCHMFIKQKPLDHKLTISFKINKEHKINK